MCVLFGVAVAVMNEYNLFIDEIGHLPDVRYCFSIKYTKRMHNAHIRHTNGLKYTQCYAVWILWFIESNLMFRPTAAIKLHIYVPTHKIDKHRHFIRSNNNNNDSLSLHSTKPSTVENV